eukprot:COSAG03_NODE_1235_length_4502_cov_2.986373_2_plen_34_part_00
MPQSEGEGEDEVEMEEEIDYIDREKDSLTDDED